jgi:hypothetical protein
MATWILVIIFMSSQGVSVDSIANVNSQQTCESIGKKVEDKEGWASKAYHICEQNN